MGHCSFGHNFHGRWVSLLFATNIFLVFGSHSTIEEEYFTPRPRPRNCVKRKSLELDPNDKEMPPKINYDTESFNYDFDNQPEEGRYPSQPRFVIPNDQHKNPNYFLQPITLKDQLQLRQKELLRLLGFRRFKPRIPKKGPIKTRKPPKNIRPGGKTKGITKKLTRAPRLSTTKAPKISSIKAPQMSTTTIGGNPPKSSGATSSTTLNPAQSTPSSSSISASSSTTPQSSKVPQMSSPIPVTLNPNSGFPITNPTNPHPVNPYPANPYGGVTSYGNQITGPYPVKTRFPIIPISFSPIGITLIPKPKGKGYGMGTTGYGMGTTGYGMGVTGGAYAQGGGYTTGAYAVTQAPVTAVTQATVAVAAQAAVAGQPQVATTVAATLGQTTATVATVQTTIAPGGKASPLPALRIGQGLFQTEENPTTLHGQVDGMTTSPFPAFQEQPDFLKNPDRPTKDDLGYLQEILRLYENLKKKRPKGMKRSIRKKLALITRRIVMKLRKKKKCRKL